MHGTHTGRPDYIIALTCIDCRGLKAEGYTGWLEVQVFVISAERLMYQNQTEALKRKLARKRGLACIELDRAHT